MTTFREPDDHVPPMGVTFAFGPNSVFCARAGIDARLRKARDLRNMGKPRAGVWIEKKELFALAGGMESGLWGCERAGRQGGGG